MHWWRGEDSNLRRQSRQIYSLIPLAAREPLRMKAIFIYQSTKVKLFIDLQQTNLKSRNKWCWHQESNPGPTDYKSVALPSELCQLGIKKSLTITYFHMGNPTLSSALVCFTSEFEMDSGGPKQLWSPSKNVMVKMCATLSKFLNLYGQVYQPISTG